jgi:Zn-dependent protease with chaperone function
MRRRLLPGLCLFLLSFPLAAQGPVKPDSGDADDDDRDDDIPVYVDVRTSPLGNVSIALLSGPAAWMDVVPAALHCDWLETSRTKYELSGTCRAWLKPSPETSSGTLRLAPLVAAFALRGATSVEVNVISSWGDFDVPAGWKGEARGRRSSYLSFTSSSPANLPSDIVIPLQRPPNLIFPILLVLSVPVLLAYIVRRRRGDAPAEQKMNWIVWMSWINLGIWLYWISVVNPTELVDFLLLLAPLGNLVRMALGVLLYSAPPLLSMGACLVAMAPLLSSSKESFRMLLNRQLVAQAAVQIPLAIVLVGTGASMGGTGSGWYATFSLVAAYVVYRGFAWLSWSMNYSEVTPLESGELFERASALAQKAGVKIARLGLLRTRVPEQANAFAMSGDKIVLTESLVRGLTPREVNAVIAHELGHHKAGHLRVNSSNTLFWVLFLAAGPILGWLVSHYHVPAWMLAVPILPLAFVVMQGWFSRRRELTADARAAEITGDPEGKIAALGRLAQLSRIPVEGRGIMGSILSHPSMENRVLALARRHNIPDARALAILRNPDEAYDSIANLAVAIDPTIDREPGEKEPVFSLKERMFYAEQLRWPRCWAPS